MLSDAGDNTESTRLSPLTSSLNSNLTFQEENMGLGENWDAEENVATPDWQNNAPLIPSPFTELTSNCDNSDPVPQNTVYGPLLPYPSLSECENLFSLPDETPDDTAAEDVPAGVCGLRNLGNTCFMAAGLQCLTATPPVLQHFLELQEQNEKLPPPGSLMANFSTLLSKMWSGRYNVLQPTEFKLTLGAYHSQFKDYRQHDCQEFLALLLDTLHEQMNLAKSNKTSHMPRATATTASVVNSNQNEEVGSCVGNSLTAANIANLIGVDDICDMASPDGPNSPNDTMAGSPRACSMGDLDSAANSLQNSPLNENEETQDSDEMANSRTSGFIHNNMHNSDYDMDSTNYFNKFDEILLSKEAKTSNANILVTTQECNNEIHYDSQKFPKENHRKVISVLENTNLTENHDFDNKNVSVKRIKEVNCQRSNSSHEGNTSSGSEAEYDTGLEKCNVKRMRLGDKEKNHKKDSFDIGSVNCLQSYENGAIASQEEIEADKHWTKHLLDNRSVIVDTFQGQFKSTVVCEVCKHVSVTYEPFMYLSVPLPHAMERQFVVTYIPANGEVPVKCVITLNKQSRIGALKDELLKTLNKEDVPASNVALAEVLDDHISKILEDQQYQYLRIVNDFNRQIFAFELNDPPEPWIENDSDRMTDEPSTSGESSSGVTTNEAVSEEQQHCIVCLEEGEGGLKKHCDGSCKLAICDNCIENYFKSGKEPMLCPDCKAEMTGFIKIDQSAPRARPTIRILSVPLVMRHDTDEVTNNRKGTKLFGYPHLLKLPNWVDAKDVWDVVRRIVLQDVKYTLHLVDGQGHHCSRCMFGSHCTGCPIPESGKLNLHVGDTIAVRYVDSDMPTIQQPIDHVSVANLRKRDPLSLYDCLQAFSQSETLDEHNPWHCPKCERNQCATKTLTVHRYPQFLIVYLKRFVFYECISMKLDDKVTFPLVGLSCGKHLYDLYACVCHFGGVSAGHYTAYAKNPQTDVWHYYNDDITSKKNPQEDDFSNAYILFYSRQGANPKQCNI